MERGRRRIGMRKWSYCLILLGNTDGTSAIVLCSNKKIWIYYSIFRTTGPLDFFRAPLFRLGSGSIWPHYPVPAVRQLVSDCLHACLCPHSCPWFWSCLYLGLDQSSCSCQDLSLYSLCVSVSVIWCLYLRLWLAMSLYLPLNSK